MKKAALILVAIILLAGCASAPKCPPSPPSDVIFMTDFGPVSVPEGFFDAGEGAGWMRLEEFKRRMEAGRRKQGGT